MTQRLAPRVGVALSGGIAKVIAHVGVLRALEEGGIRIHALAGSSGGSIIGAFYAAGWKPREMAELAGEISWKKLTRVTLPRMGLLSNERMETFVTERLGDLRFEDLEIPLAVVAANLSTGHKAVFTKGRIAPPIRATCSVPQLFSPVVLDGDLIADGGLVEYLPVETLEELGCDVKIAVNLGGIRNWHEKNPGNLFEVALRVVGFVSQRNALLSERRADCVIRPDLARFGPYELDRSEELIEAGYEAARTAVPRILELCREREEPVEAGEWNRVVRWLRKHSPIQPFGRKAS